MLDTWSELEDTEYNEFDGIINFRDVGKTVNAFLGKKVLKEGILFRSAKLDDASYKDRIRLTEVYGIKSVIDLRSKTEHLNAQEKHKFLQKNLPLKIPGITYTRIILPSRRFELFLLWQLSWFNILPPSLSLNTLSHSSPSISLCLSSCLSGHPKIIHCTQGKDRTGLLTLLILLILHTPVQAITHDYHLTNSTSPLIRSIRLAEVREVGLPDSFAETDQAMVSSVISWLDATYGGVDGYLDAIGFGEQKRERLREILLCRGEDDNDAKEKDVGISPASPSASSSDLEEGDVIVVQMGKEVGI
ncbi:hypothetical protein QC764_205925 [Podospora pseudoanserina]|uniref:Tyrosine specific protein phosphatases domain-containing protein n=1 Tax=Podospora pseudoanserina TaxID=2609844 RepID=A0ABR0IIH5_9PEZI|nr:hypothetical protein QC764_205925 [Podospora pseudoanserina]